MLNTAKLSSEQQLRKSLLTASRAWPRRWSWVAVAALSAVLAGCDAQKLESSAQQADRQVQKTLRDAYAERSSQKPEAQKTATDFLKEAAANKDASNVDQALAQGMLADAEMAAAIHQLMVVNAEQVQISRLLDQMGQICIQAGNSAQAAKVLRQGNDPGVDPAKSVVDGIEQQQKALQAKVEEKKAEVHKLSVDIQRRQQQIDGFQHDQKIALDAQRSLEEQARQAKGEQALAFYAKANEARVRVGTAAADIEASSAELLPVQEAMSRATAVQAVFAAGIEEYKNQLKLMQDQWQELQTQQIAACDAQAKAQAQSLTAATLAEGERKSLADMFQDVQAKRHAAITTLESAKSHYQQATASANKVYGELNAKIQAPGMQQSEARKTWTALRDTINQSAYREMEGNALTWMGNVYTTQALELRQRQRLAGLAKTALGQMDMEVPGPLAAGSMQQDLEATLKDGNTAYAEAIKTLDQIPGAPSTTPAIKSGGLFTKAMSLFGQYILNSDPSYYNLAKVAVTDSGSHIELPSLTSPSSESPAPPPAPTPHAD